MSDRNYYSYADVSNVVIPRNEIFAPENPLEYDDILKFSNAKNIVGDGIVVKGGKENCIDMNRTCEGITLVNVTLVGGNQAAIVIKGGSRNIGFENVKITPSPTAWCDILIGDWSDQSNERSTQIYLGNVTRTDDQPVRVVVGRAEKPTIHEGNCKIMTAESLGLKTYWWAKFIARKLHFV